MNKFGDLIRSTREEREMLLRHIAAELDVDTALVSKIERGEKTAKREHVLARRNQQRNEECQGCVQHTF